MNFESLGLATHLVRAVSDKGYSTPTEIQQQAIPPILEGRDLLGCSQTGTGKTAAFALPLLQRLSNEPARRDGNRQGRRPIRAVILAPTRELALQIGQCLVGYSAGSSLRTTVIFGGVSQFRQTRDLQRGVDIVVATPGRLLDLYEQGFIDFSQVQIVVLDEADHLLDMGFLPDVNRILTKLPRQRQSLLFSATMPTAIGELARRFLSKPVHISVTPGSPAADRVEQGVYFASRPEKPVLLAQLIEGRPSGSTLVFSRTKRGADKISKYLGTLGVRAESIHGNKSQNARQRALESFRSGRTRVLVATDIAARGIDVRGIQYVINYDFPETPESYVHRIGRTGRAGEVGDAVSLCAGDERDLLGSVERHLRTRLPVLSAPTQQPRRTVERSEGAPRPERPMPNGRSPRRGPPHAGGSRRRRPQQRSGRPKPAFARSR